MYNYPHYKEKDREKIIQFMREESFATLIGTDKNGRIAISQIPVLVEERDGKIFLVGHMARKSDHHQAFEENPQIVALFTSPHTYVSGSWYTGNPYQASTWNYISVHARGPIRFQEEKDLVAVLKKLTLYFEKGDTSSTTIYDNLPEDYLAKLVKAIIGFEIEVTELDNVYKLSQNRDQKSYLNIIDQLEQQDAAGQYIAKRMKENKARLFPETT